MGGKGKVFTTVNMGVEWGYCSINNPLTHLINIKLEI